MEQHDLTSIIEYFRDFEPELLEFVNRGDYFTQDVLLQHAVKEKMLVTGDFESWAQKQKDKFLERVRKDMFLKFIALVKWPEDFFICQKEGCGERGIKTFEYGEIRPFEDPGKYKQSHVRTRRCYYCKVWESPVAGTSLEDVKLTAFFSIAFVMLTQPKVGRLTDVDIFNLLTRKKSNPDSEKQSSNNSEEDDPEKKGTLCDNELAGTRKLVDRAREDLKILNDLIYLSNSDSTSVYQKEWSEYKKGFVAAQRSADNWIDYLKSHRPTLEFNIEQYSAELRLPTNRQVKISLSSVERYRDILRQYLGDWGFGYSTVSGSPYGIEALRIARGSNIRYIFVARQLSPQQIIRTSIYGDNSIRTLEKFIKTYLPDNAYKILYRFDQSVKDHYKSNHLFSFGKYWDDMDIHPYAVGEVINALKLWFMNPAQRKIFQESMTGYVFRLKRDNVIYASASLLQPVISPVDISNEKRLQQHINECVALNFYDGLDISIWIMLACLYPCERPRKRGNKNNRSYGPSPVANQTKIGHF